MIWNLNWQTILWIVVLIVLMIPIIRIKLMLDKQDEWYREMDAKLREIEDEFKKDRKDDI